MLSKRSRNLTLQMVITDLKKPKRGGLEDQACNWVWDDWDDRDSKGIWEIYASIYIFNAHLLIRLYVFAMLATSPATI